MKSALQQHPQEANSQETPASIFHSYSYPLIYIEKKQNEKKRKGDLYRVFANIFYIKMAQFLLIKFWVWEMPTLHSFISGIFPSFFKILVHILLQISCKLGSIVIKIYTEIRIEVSKYLLCYKCSISGVFFKSISCSSLLNFL